MLQVYGGYFCCTFAFFPFLRSILTANLVTSTAPTQREHTAIFNWIMWHHKSIVLQSPIPISDYCTGISTNTDTDTNISGTLIAPLDPLTPDIRPLNWSQPVYGLDFLTFMWKLLDPLTKQLCMVVHSNDNPARSVHSHYCTHGIVPAAIASKTAS